TVTVTHRSQMFQWKIEAGITIEFPVGSIARITSLCAPDLPAGIAIARKRGWPGWCITRCINRVTRTRLSKQQPVRIENEPANVGLFQNRFQTGRVSAFRQPKPGRFDTEEVHIDIASNQNLSASSFARLLQEQGKQAMRRGGGNDLQPACFQQFPKRGEQIAFVFLGKEAPGFAKDLRIKIRELSQPRVIAIPLCFARSEID